MLRADQIRCGIAGALAIVSFVPAHDLPVGAWLAIVCADVLALNAVGQFFVPARYSVMRAVVHGDADRARAAGIAQATSATLVIVGPPLAAPLLFGVGLQWALVFNAVSYLVSFIAIRSVKIAPKPAAHPASLPGPAAGQPMRPSVLREFAAGLRFFGASRFLVALLTLAVIGQFGIGAVNALDVFFLTRNLHASAQLYGYLGTAFGIGGIIGALMAGRVVGWIGARATAWAGLLRRRRAADRLLPPGELRRWPHLDLPGGHPDHHAEHGLGPAADGVGAAGVHRPRGRGVPAGHAASRDAVYAPGRLAGQRATARLRGRPGRGAARPDRHDLRGGGLLVIAAGLYGRSLPALNESKAKPAEEQSAESQSAQAGARREQSSLPGRRQRPGKRWRPRPGCWP